MSSESPGLEERDSDSQAATNVVQQECSTHALATSEAPVPEHSGLPAAGADYRSATSDGQCPSRTVVFSPLTREETASKSVPVKVVVRCRPQLSPTAQPLQISVRPSPSVSEAASNKGQNTEGMTRLEITMPNRQSMIASVFAANKVAKRTADVNHVFLGSATNPEVFAYCADIVDRCMEGFNGTIFAYGVTGSGKTYTMIGPEHDPGIVLQVANRIFDYIRHRATEGESYLVQACFCEIYVHEKREELIDLVTSDRRGFVGEESSPIRIRENVADNNWVLEGISMWTIANPEELVALLRKGQTNQTTMATTRNNNSSRSHSLFQITVEGQRVGEKKPRQGKLLLVDLGGSESLKNVKAHDAEQEELRQKQAIGINSVLTSLGTVVTQLNRHANVNYRESGLTKLLKDCLGGNARALMVAQIIPEVEHADEVSKTLDFAAKLATVENQVRINRVDESHSLFKSHSVRAAELLKRVQKEQNPTEKARIRAEVQTLNSRILTKDTVTEMLVEVAERHAEKMAEVQSIVHDGIASFRQTFEGLQEQDETIRSNVTGTVEKLITDQRLRDGVMATALEDRILQLKQAMDSSSSSIGTDFEKMQQERLRTLGDLGQHKVDRLKSELQHRAEMERRDLEVQHQEEKYNLHRAASEREAALQRQISEAREQRARLAKEKEVLQLAKEGLSRQMPTLEEQDAKLRQEQDERESRSAAASEVKSSLHNALVTLGARLEEVQKDLDDARRDNAERIEQLRHEADTDVSELEAVGRDHQRVVDAELAELEQECDATRVRQDAEAKKCDGLRERREQLRARSREQITLHDAALLSQKDKAALQLEARRQELHDKLDKDKRYLSSHAQLEYQGMDHELMHAEDEYRQLAADLQQQEDDRRQAEELVLGVQEQIWQFLGGPDDGIG
mmetsp:Transcript_11057/g.24224  ORF Transcript_11057/g.24224 Transcript_11057/m.24224 type:complete len:912 (-) Transcript_11057:72-2807(-)